ncbi:hypothetical protein ZOSMA_288G00130 [Zostera marina]|uniref:Uncharacterized protein n=1 Tax=Zostera marina TaxID=29655 RepID=A0A0K9PF18_ZOSMR|nr:hypothetical protein ZOSMA_288G00130 [Zostera marina]
MIRWCLLSLDSLKCFLRSRRMGGGSSPTRNLRRWLKIEKNKAQPTADFGYRPPALNDLQHQNRMKARSSVGNIILSATPAILPTPKDMAKEKWGVDGYGSMKGLIRLRSPTSREEEEEGDGEDVSSESDVEEHIEIKRRLDQDLSHVKMLELRRWRGRWMRDGFLTVILIDDISIIFL